MIDITEDVLAATEVIQNALIDSDVDLMAAELAMLFGVVFMLADRCETEAAVAAEVEGACSILRERTIQRWRRNHAN